MCESSVNGASFACSRVQILRTLIQERCEGEDGCQLKGKDRAKVRGKDRAKVRDRAKDKVRDKAKVRVRDKAKALIMQAGPARRS
jgi:hypothetical protein